MFQSISNLPGPTHLSENRKLREKYHQKIRKQALDKKIASMRRSLLMNMFQEEVEEETKQEENFLQSFDLKYREKLSQQRNKDGQKESFSTIVKSLSILSKFYRLRLESKGSSQIKKFVKKLDAIICLLISIDEWIMEDEARRDIETELKMRQQGTELEVQRESINETLNEQELSLRRLDELRPLRWTQRENRKPSLQILKQLIHIVLFQKIDEYLQTIIQPLSAHKVHNTDTVVISPTLIKWLFFYESNMKMFYLDSNQCFKSTLQELSLEIYWKTICSYYFQILQSVLKVMTIYQITEVFFNSFKDVKWFKGTIELTKGQLFSRYITCSPFQYLLVNKGEGQKLLKYLEIQMLSKIQFQEKHHVIQKMKALTLNQQNMQLIHCLQEQEIQIQKAKRILSTLFKKLKENKTL